MKPRRSGSSRGTDRPVRFGEQRPVPTIPTTAGAAAMNGIRESADGAMSTERGLRWVILLGAASVVVYLCLLILRPFASVIAWSSVLAIICYPVHQWLVRKTGRIALSALITSLLTVLAFVLPLIVVGGIAVNECVALGPSLQRAFQHREQPLKDAAALARMIGAAGLDEAAIAAWIQQHISEWGQRAAQYTVSIAAGLLEAVVSCVFVVVTMFLLLRDGQNLTRAIPDLLPFERLRSEALLRRMKDVVQASVYGVVVLALLQGVLYGAMFWLLGIPSAALWAMVTVFASVLPVVGALAVWGPCAVYLALTGHWLLAIVLTLWALLVNAIDQVLKPRLVAGRVGLSELAMFFALLGGLSVFGGLGVVLGPVAFAAVVAIVDTLREPEAGRTPAGANGQVT
jgi:predicted PurR-regulated permease PerM